MNSPTPRNFFTGGNEASSHVTADGVELATWEWVGEQARVSPRSWSGLQRSALGRSCPRFASAGPAVSSVDLRGHGLSAKPRDGFDFETMAADLAGLIEQRMSPPVIAAGQSFGGNLVLELAARHPELVSGVVCVDGGFVDLQSAWPDWNDALELLTPPPLDHLHG